MTQIAFIGLGNMGHPMARSLLKANFPVHVYDLSEASRNALAIFGATPKSSLADAVRDADVVITMVPTGKHVRAVYEGPDGVLQNAKPQALLIDCSTIDVDTSKVMNATARSLGYEMVDAPVTGSVSAAEKSALTFMVGGTVEAYEHSLPILRAMGAAFFHVGEAGAGLAMKICNNMMTGIILLANSEAFELTRRFGIDDRLAFEVLSLGSAGSWVLKHYCPVPGLVPTSPASYDYTPGFSTDLMLKDMRLSQSAAASLGASTGLAACASAMYQLASNQGYGHKDCSYVFEVVRGGTAKALPESTVRG